MASPPATLADWLAHWERIHPRTIALGLERVGEVARLLGLGRPAPLVLTVAGTNGKGSTVAFLDAILRAADRVVGAFTSPHLLHYNERIRVDGEPVDDVELIAAFRRIEAARGDVPLTYFEAGTLAALAVFQAREVDVAVLEVGLGGRLDAVNLVDADAVVLTTVDLDHQDWLGADREAIGAEKAGVMRAGAVAVLGEDAPPASVLDHAARIGAPLQRAGIDFGAREAADRWTWWHADGTRLDLPLPTLAAPVQRRNAAASIAALHALRGRIAVPADAFARGVATARVPGRLQRVGESPEIVVDVGHNPQAARELARWLAQAAPRRTVAVFSALADKDIEGIVAPLAAHVGTWFVAGLDGESPRGLPAEAVAARVRGAGVEPRIAATIAGAIGPAREAAGAEGRVVVFGSFFTVAAALRAAGIARA
jgi:dihydrofolate synthase/folylpolyglutamate synthase